MGRRLPDWLVPDGRRIGLGATLFTIVICLFWLADGWGLFGSRLSTNTSAIQVARLWGVGPPVLGLLAASTILSLSGRAVPPTRNSVWRSDSNFAAIGDVPVGDQDRYPLERADDAQSMIIAIQERSSRLAGEAHTTLQALETLLGRVDELSKETTSKIAKRAYALDAALEGVLNRSETVFEEITQARLSTAMRFADDLKALLGDATQRMSAELAQLHQQLAISTTTLALNRDLSRDHQDGANRREPIAVELDTADALLRLLTRSAGDSGNIDAGHVVDLNARTPPPLKQAFLAKFETLVGRALSIRNGDDLVRSLLRSELGALYRVMAREAGRLSC